MTTDLRAALRDNRDTLAWLLTDQQDQQHDEIDADDDHREMRQRAVDALTRLVALADAPPTVAELLPRVADSTREVHWTDTDGDRWRAFAVVGGRSIGFVFRRNDRGDWYDGNPCDLTQPARLVEVTP